MSMSSRTALVRSLLAERRGWSLSTAGEALGRHGSPPNSLDDSRLHPWSTPTTSPAHASQVGIGSALLAMFLDPCSAIAWHSFNAMTGMPIGWLSGTPFLREGR